MTSAGAAIDRLGASTNEPAGITPGTRLVARSCEVAAAPPEAFLTLDLPGEPGFWDGRPLGDERALAHAGVAWSAPITSATGDAAFAEAGRAAAALLERLELPALRALVAVPFDGEQGFVRVPRFAYEGTDAGGRLIAIGDPRVHDVDADLSALRRTWEAALGRPVRSHRLEATVLDDGRARYGRLVAEALAAIEAGTFEKVVTARRLEIALARAPDLASLVGALPRARVARFVVGRGAETFFGATPETLVRLHGGEARADALAGSRPAPGPAQAGDRSIAGALSAELLGSDKDRREHALVVAFVRRALEQHGALDPETAPSLLRLPNVWHLHTPIGARVRAGVTAFDLVAALHPTPAVLGVPSHAARTWLGAHERFSRGLYAGSLGTLDARGEGTFVVGIRSARAFADPETGAPRASLYAGGGIVSGSDVEKELDETDAKLAPLRHLFGLGSDTA